MKQADGQISIFDWNPKLQTEPEVGEWFEECGAAIPYIMVKGYIGKKVLVDMSTQSHRWYKVCILEDIIPDHYYHRDVAIETDRYVLFDGGRQRGYRTYMPGKEYCVLHECLPWDAYERTAKQ